MSAALPTSMRLLLKVCLLAIGQACVAVGQTPTGDTTQEKLLDAFRYAPVVPKAIDVWNPPKINEIAGTIDELDDKHIVYRDAAKSHDIPSNRVIQVTTTWRTPAASEAHTLFLQRRYRDAKEAIPKAAKNDLPRWQQRLMVAEFVDTLVALGDTRVAGSVYLTSLAAHQPPVMLYAQLPLNWTNIEPDRLLFESAVEWLRQEDEAAQLLGASWLLFGAEHESAQATLTKLQSSKREPIAVLAVAQSWRLVPPPNTEAKLSDWLEFRDRMLEPLQLGQPCSSPIASVASTNKNLRSDCGHAWQRSIQIAPITSTCR